MSGLARWCAARTVGWARAASLGVGARRASTLGAEGEAVVGANYKMDGADPVLKADDQYPDWLWEISMTKPDLNQLSPKDKAYWQRAAKLKLHRNNQIQIEKRGK